MDKVNSIDLCCVPTVRTPYDKQYSFGFDRKIKNWQGCGVKYIQELPPVCKPDVPMEECFCNKSYYDC